MGLTSCIGRYGLLVTSVIFVLGVLISTSTPSWLESQVETPGQLNVIVQTQFGPFFSQNRTCTATAGQVANETSDCSDWEQNPIDNGDCSMFNAGIYDAERRDKLCQQLTAWRALGEICVLIVMGTAILVAVATTTQCITCGCCGGSFDVVAMILCWIEVVLSICAWSLAISTVSMMKDESIGDVLSEEASLVFQAAQDQDALAVTTGRFLWGFWLFIISGTIFGAISAILADWAGKGSLLSCLWTLVSCLFCCKK